MPSPGRRTRGRGRGTPPGTRHFYNRQRAHSFGEPVDSDIVEFEDARAVEALKDAESARERAYAPYSGFKMGAAVVTEHNDVIQGTLVENVSLGLAMCSERAALFAAVAQGSGRPEILALVSPRTGGNLTWPCGACLQVAQELGGRDLLVVVSDGSQTEQARLSDLAPRFPFKGARG